MYLCAIIDEKMVRQKIKELENWKLSPFRKPLVVLGPRQVGKSWLIREFGKRSFKHTVYINFELHTDLQCLFVDDFHIQRIISALQAYTQQKITPDETLIVFDEIQYAPKGLSFLESISISAPAYYVIATHSVWGNSASLPVPKVDFLNLYPMSFYEFLLAVGQAGLAKILEDRIWDVLPVYANRFKEYLRYYFYVGGMPQAVAQFAENRDWERIREIQNSIINTYQSDFSKEAPNNEVSRIQMVWQTIPTQLKKENKKFMYGGIRHGARAKDFEGAIKWLVDSGFLMQTHKISKPTLPLTSYCDSSTFKLFFNDVGLLAAQFDLNAKTIIGGYDIFTDYQGALTEQYVIQQLTKKRDHPLYFWTNDKSTTGVDIIMQHEGGIIPIEIKVEENLKAKSFKFFYDKYNPKNAIRASLSNYRKEPWLTQIPLYIIGNYFPDHK